MSHQSLYRTYRPTTFAEVAGQEHIERTLRNAVASGNVAHAYLFSGPRGTGKTTTARILAAALLCEHTHDGEPDGSCEQCIAISEGTHPDVIELDAASRRKLENVQEEIINRVQYAPSRGRYKVYLIDEVHMLTKEAFNALLKTLEEPPAHVVFVLCTTDPQKVLPTVRSRCQEFDFHPVGIDDMTARLQFIADSEGIKAENAALSLIARHADGGMRDGITMLEQLATFTGNDITTTAVESSFGGVDDQTLAELMRAVARRDTSTCFAWVAQQVSSGADLSEVLRSLLGYVRDMYVIAVLGSSTSLIDRRAEDVAVVRSVADEFAGPDRVARVLDLLSQLSDSMRWSTEPRILVELTLVRATRPEGELTLEALAERLERLEQGSALAESVSASGDEQRSADRGSVSKPADVAELAAATAGNDVQNCGGDAYHASPPSSNEVAPVRPVAKKLKNEPAMTSSDGHTPPAFAALESDVADMKRNWRAVLDEVRKLNVPRYPVFADTQAVLAEDGKSLVVEFPADGEFRLKRAKQPENGDLLSRAIAAVYGQEVPFTLGLGSYQTAVAAPPEPTFVGAGAVAPPYEGPPLGEPLIPADEPTVNDISDEVTALPVECDCENGAGDAVAANDADGEIGFLQETPPQDRSSNTKPPPPPEVASLLDNLGAVVISQTYETDE